jgi:hypothetical protein
MLRAALRFALAVVAGSASVAACGSSNTSSAPSGGTGAPDGGRPDGALEAGRAGEAGPTLEGGSTAGGDSGATGGGHGGGLCAPCKSDSDCASNDVCIYWGDNDAYFCAPICTNGVCAAGLDCGGDGEDIDQVHTYNVCFPPSNICGDGGP